jgi:hypothetical protein
MTIAARDRISFVESRISFSILLAGYVAITGITASSALAQDRPFVFSMTTTREATAPAIRIDYDVGAGEQTFRADTGKGPEHRIGVHASVGRWTLVGRFGVSSTGEAYASSQQGEVLYSLIPSSSRIALAAGGGVLHEAGGVDVLLARVTSGRETRSWRVHGNALLQKPLRAGRDAVDLITSLGWARKIRPAMAVGVEAIGEDLEGFWEEEEAEGGARLLVGPSVHFAPRDRRWQITGAGGPVFHKRRSSLASGAERDLPPTTSPTSYALKMALSVTF